MNQQQRRYIVDGDGRQRAVILDIEEYEMLMGQSAAMQSATAEQGTPSESRAHDSAPPLRPRAETAPSMDQLAAEQGISPVEDISTLKGDFWPEDESVDEFLEYIRRLRQES